eukprot:Awhi_evm1s2013
MALSSSCFRGAQQALRLALRPQASFVTRRTVYTHNLEDAASVLDGSVDHGPDFE